MKAYMFPGQGSQARGMGAALFDAYPALTDRAGDILGYSVRDLCLEDPEQRLGQTQFTQPALYVVNALAYLHKRECEGPPDYLIGHSLGEYNALFAAGVFDFDTGLRLVEQRGALMGRARGGGMAAVIGLDEDRVRGLLAEHGADAVDIANLNSPSQVVIAGDSGEIARLQEHFERAGARRYAVLRVSAAFHSRFMRPAMAELAQVLAGHGFAPPAIPVIANLSARPYRTDRIRETLCEQIASPVRWCESIRYLMGKGVDELVECGHGFVLAGLAAQIRREAAPLVVDDAAEAAEANDNAPASMSAAAPEAMSAPAPVPAGMPVRMPVHAPVHRATITPASLGSASFREDHGLRHAYVAGSTFEGISSTAMVVRLGKAGLLGYFGARGLDLDAIDAGLRELGQQLGDSARYGISLWHDPDAPQHEHELVALYLRHDVRRVEATGYLQMTPALVRFRLTGAHRDRRGRPVAPRRVLARLAHPELARAFMSPAPAHLLEQLVAAGELTREEAALGKELPMSEELCVHVDAGGPTDMGSGTALLPATLRLRDHMARQYAHGADIRVGLSGGLGTPEAVAAAFVLGADFVVTGTLNQCSPEAGTSARVKDMLQAAQVQDTAYAPAGEGFDMGARIQVLRRGVLFPARASRLHALYRQHASLDELDGKTRDQLERRYFQRELGAVWQDMQARWQHARPHDLARAERDPRHRMALVFRWYFLHSSELARRGDERGAVDYQVHCSPAMGAFNQWVQGTALERWQDRHVELVAERLMQGAADLLAGRLRTFQDS